MQLLKSRVILKITLNPLFINRSGRNPKVFLWNSKFPPVVWQIKRQQEKHESLTSFIAIRIRNISLSICFLTVVMVRLNLTLTWTLLQVSLLLVHQHPYLPPPSSGEDSECSGWEGWGPSYRWRLCRSASARNLIFFKKEKKIKMFIFILILFGW